MQGALASKGERKPLWYMTQLDNLITPSRIINALSEMQEAEKQGVRPTPMLRVRYRVTK